MGSAPVRAAAEDRVDELGTEFRDPGLKAGRQAAAFRQAIADDRQQAIRATMGPVMRVARSLGDDTAALVALNSLSHTTGPGVSHHPPAGHGHGGGHHG